MLTYLFPGQGSQTRGMGAQLFPEFSDLVRTADDILGYSIKTLCLEDPQQQLNLTQFTQPALYTVNALSYFKKMRETSMKPDYVAGHSLGEYNALLAAGVFDFATGLQLVKKRGELMSQALAGGMAAIVGLHSHQVTQLLTQHQLSDISIANYNSHTQHVITGPRQSIDKAQTIFAGISSFIPLKVSGAFHSSFMLPAEQQFSEFLQQLNFHTPTLPVIANLNAEPYHPAIIRTNLANQMKHSVRWTASIEYLLKQDDMQFVEIGPGNVLTGLLHRIRNNQ